jgi:outer membrane protein TolC
MRISWPRIVLLFSVLLAGGCSAGVRFLLLPEQRYIDVRDPSALAHVPVPEGDVPPTVLTPPPEGEVWPISLDEALRIGLENSRVVRVLAGVTAVSSGRTIYDPAIANTVIDQQRGRFDPRLDVNNTFNRNENPQGILDPSDPTGARIGGVRVDQYDFNLGLAQTNVIGGTASLGVTDNVARFQPGLFPLNPQERSALTLSYTQPLLQGAGRRANLAPVVIAQIGTERSFFQFKDSVQDLVRGIIDAYWTLVFARTDVWARRQQVQQGKEAFELASARLRAGLASAADVAQARLALANFQATLIGSNANLLQREAALRNLLGLPPTDVRQLVPVTPPTGQRMQVNWDEIVRLAEERRPELIELKLILEADEQLLWQSQNQSLPRLDAVALYRWNGLEGTTPSRAKIESGPGEFTDWTLGVNFSVPLGQRQARAALRQQQLILARDRANLEQGVHSMVHVLALSIRNLDQFHEQYQAFKEARAAARTNLDQQFAQATAGRAIFLNVLQAIADWGNAVSAEAQTLTLYNTGLANLERETGTILETHGVHFYQERFQSVGPLGRLAKPVCYPASLPPTPNAPHYPTGTEPAENFFGLASPVQRRAEPEPLPPPEPADKPR